jgi:hypothetical protein
MFQLTDEEIKLMVSQNAIPLKQYLVGSLCHTRKSTNLVAGFFILAPEF